MFFGDGLEFPAYMARFPPLPIAEFAPAVDALVFRVCDELQVLDSVVEFVSVDVMYAATGRDWSVGLLPHNVMLQSQPSVKAPSEMALGGDVATVASGWFRSCFPHANSLTV